MFLMKRFVFPPQADADDIDTWMLDVLRIVSSVDVGHDEFSTQALVKKHKDVAEEISSYRPVIDALHEQSRTLLPEKADSEEVKLAEQTGDRIWICAGPDGVCWCVCRFGLGWRASRSATRRWWS